MIKRLFAIALSVIITISMVGCAYVAPEESTRTSNKEETSTTTTESTTEVTTEATTSITYKSLNLMSIKFKVPDAWYCVENSDEITFYPDKFNEDIVMMISYLGSNKDAINQCEAVFESVVDELPGSQNADVKINKKVTMTDGDFFIGKVDYTATDTEMCMHALIQFMCDLKTGSFYVFVFASPEKVSEENKQIFNEVLNSVSTDYDF